MLVTHVFVTTTFQRKRCATGCAFFSSSSLSDFSVRSLRSSSSSSRLLTWFFGVSSESRSMKADAFIPPSFSLSPCWKNSSTISLLHRMCRRPVLLLCPMSAICKRRKRRKRRKGRKGRKDARTQGHKDARGEGGEVWGGGEV